MAQIGPSNPNAPKHVFTDDDKVKDQLTYFYPKEDWKGEYGFDWFRLHTCPEPEKINDKGDKAEINFNNIGKHVYPLLKRCLVIADFDEDPNGDVIAMEFPAYTDDQRGITVDIRSDKERNSESKVSEVEEFAGQSVDNDVDIARIFSSDQFALFYFERGHDRIPVVCEKKPDGTYTNFRYYEYQSTRNDNEDSGPGHKEVRFRFYPHYADDVLMNGEDVYYEYYVVYNKGDVERLVITRYQEYLNGNGEIDENGEPKKEKKSEFKRFHSKGEVKRASEQQKKDSKKNKKKGKKKKGENKEEEKKLYEKWDYDMTLIDKIYDNNFMDEESLKKDYRIKDIDVMADRKRLEVTYKDGHKVIVLYESGEAYMASYYEDENSEKCTCWASGYPSFIKDFFKKQKYNIDAKLIDDVYLDYDDDYFKNQAKSVLISMEPAYPVVMNLTVEASDIKYTAQIGKKNPISGFKQKLMIKEAKGSFYRKDGRYRFKEEEKTIPFEDVELHPYWESLWQGNFWTVKVGDDNIFYPHPHLSLVNYRWRDKTRGLENDTVELKVKTFGEFDKIKFKSSGTDVFDTKIGSGSTTKSEDTIKLKAKGSNEGYEDYLLATEENKNEVTGCMFVHVYDPLHLKLCFVNVHFNVVEYDDMDVEGETAKPIGRKVVQSPSSSTGAAKGWTPDDDQYLQILGQAGIIFDDIATEELQVEEYYSDTKDKGRITQSELDMVTGYEAPDYNEEGTKFYNTDFMRLWDSGAIWDSEKDEYVVSSNYIEKYLAKRDIDFTFAFDQLFMKAHPEYGGYIRVYILDKYMINDDKQDSTEERNRRKEHWNLSRYQLSYVNWYEYSGCSFAIFKKSIEKTDATKSNPLAHALLRYLGMSNSFSDFIDTNYAYKTTSNVMDYNDLRYTLDHRQWAEMREGAEKVQFFLSEDKKKWDDYAEQRKKNNKSR